MRILYVDDEPDLRDVTAAVLERDGDLWVRTATSAAEGLSVLESERVDCIVSDYDMPGRDGLEFCDAVRDRGFECPFVLFTGHGVDAVASDAAPVGVDGYVRKGTGTGQYETLATCVREAVGDGPVDRGRERTGWDPSERPSPARSR